MPLPPTLPRKLESILSRVQTPGQYVGGELNAVRKPLHDLSLRVALAFTDVYSVGMSYHGLHVLYELVNRCPTWYAERVFAPFPDMEAALRDAGLPLGTLETWTPLSQMDAIGFSVPYELGGTSLLTILDLGGVPADASGRGVGMPFVIAGGHATFNPEPLSDFVDLFVIGEGEEALPEVLARLEAHGGRLAEDRTSVLRDIASNVSGVYVPCLYDLKTTAVGVVLPGVSASSPPLPVKRRIFRNFANTSPPTAPVVPTVETVHERVVLEVMRGCPNGCRFCQAGFVCRPVRSRPVGELLAAAETCYRNTGYDEIGLLSLSTSNYPGFDGLVSALDREFSPRKVSLSLPSLRVDHALSGIPERFKTVRRGGFTIAPEAGSDALRARINKDVTNDNLLAAAEEAYKQGWQTIKLYFMVGLPGETDEDVAAIADLANRVARLRRKGSKKKHAVNLSLSNFVPKPHTPLQWEPMASRDELRRKQRIVGDAVDRRRVSFKAHDVETSFLEAAFSRGDRRLGAVLLRAWRNGARLDAWGDYFRPAIWKAAFEEEGVSPAFYAERGRELREDLPWRAVDSGISDRFLRSERARMAEARPTPMCSERHCAGCGVEACSHIDPDSQA